MIVNLTPHPIVIYPPNTPDHIEPGSVEPVLTIEPSPDHKPARIGMIELGTQYEGLGVPVEDVEYASHGGLEHPLPSVQSDDRGRPVVWYAVSLVVALQQTYIYRRPDLLVPHREVRNLAGSVIGCRQLARPV